jgi:hypothetical protein
VSPRSQRRRDEASAPCRRFGPRVGAVIGVDDTQSVVLELAEVGSGQTSLRVRRVAATSATLLETMQFQRRFARGVPATMLGVVCAIGACSPAIVATDAGRDVLAPTDSSSAADAADVAIVAPSDAQPADVSPADVASDATCNPVSAERPMPMGQCDGRGMQACSSWAQQNAAGNPMANAICLSSAQSGCARADQCSNASDPSTCRCGASAACVAGEVCVTVGPVAVCRPVQCP